MSEFKGQNYREGEEPGNEITSALYISENFRLLSIIIANQLIFLILWLCSQYELIRTGQKIKILQGAHTCTESVMNSLE